MFRSVLLSLLVFLASAAFAGNPRVQGWEDQFNTTSLDLNRWIISRGGQVLSRQTNGFGTYEWRMRMASVSINASDTSGASVSGGVSAGFAYINNSETEIDFEFAGHIANTAFMANWKNTRPQNDPLASQSTVSWTPLYGISQQFHTYKYVWTRRSIEFYVDGVLKAAHSSNIPTAPAYFMMNQWGTNNPNWGGTATVGTTRYFYIDWVRFTPQ